MRRRDFEALCSLVHEMAGINLHQGKQELVRARLSKRMRSLHLYDLSEYLQYVEEDKTQAELITMLDTLSTNLTSFFREKKHFEFVKNVVIPEIVSRAGRTGSYPLRVWSAGCSTGEEPYTLAICLLEHLPDKRRFDPKILATDISTRVLDTATRGFYPEERLQNIPTAMRHRYFRAIKSDGHKICEISNKAKSIVRFKRLNLMDAWTMRGVFDFIFCRNTMIYFDKPTQARLVDRFHDSLKSGGYLIVGHSESLTGTGHRFKYKQPTIFKKN